MPDTVRKSAEPTAAEPARDDPNDGVTTMRTLRGVILSAGGAVLRLEDDGGVLLRRDTFWTSPPPQRFAASDVVEVRMDRDGRSAATNDPLVRLTIRLGDARTVTVVRRCAPKTADALSRRLNEELDALRAGRRVSRPPGRDPTRETSAPFARQADPLAGRVIAYAKPVPAGEIEIYRRASGGVIILIHPTRIERFHQAAAAAFPLLILVVCAGLGGAAREPAVLYLLGAILASAGVVWLVEAVRSSAKSIVIAADAEELYVEFPARVGGVIRRPRDDVTSVAVKPRYRGAIGPRAVCIAFRGGHAPLHLCDSRPEAERERVAAVLLEALRLPA
jgi:hypothetical protein